MHNGTCARVIKLEIYLREKYYKKNLQNVFILSILYANKIRVKKLYRYVKFKRFNDTV